MKLLCHHCKHIWNTTLPVSRSEECPNCKRDARVCKNCQFFDANYHNQCRESESEWIVDKESANFCSYYRPSQDVQTSAQSSADLEALNNLFKK